MSQRAIASTRHISTKSVAAVWRKTDELGISLADVTDKTLDDVYTLALQDYLCYFAKELQSM